MAQKVITQLVDDIDGTDLGDGDGETVVFALDGQTYEIDLSTKNAEVLRSAVAKYVEAGRRVGRATGRASKRTQSGPAAAEIRDWARSNGFEVPDRGRIPQGVREAFDKR
ncbi:MULTISPECIES: histone-like nucleoid-structuring protein Lsr2 [unclassified Nocardioides]|uniref:histone-like nucleoid-structuring protein Lsr2 n=1 Tax=unclassified Nocardioides TaxID=2615069 RepID=UPI003014DA94